MTRMPPESTALPQPVTEVVAVVSQRAGIGRTTTAVNLALALAAAGRHVLLLDLDPKGDTGRCLVRGGGQGHGHAGSERVLLEAALTRDMLVATEIPDLYLAPAGSALGRIESELTLMGDSRTRLYQALITLPAMPLTFDHIIIDCPATLGLLTLNALTAAHRVLLPVIADAQAVTELGNILKTISRLRASFTHPLYGVYALISQTDQAPTAALTQLQHDYERMLLTTTIPFAAALRDSSELDRPVLAQGIETPINQAYLTLAAEWLTLNETGDQADGTWQLKTQQMRMNYHRTAIQTRIAAWLIDPSSLLYDPTEAMRHQDAVVLEELFQVTQPARRLSIKQPPVLVSAVLLLVVLLPLLGWWRGWQFDQQWRIELGALLIGKAGYWQAGSQLLALADATAYRELLFATQLIENNRAQLLQCSEHAQHTRDSTNCTIRVLPK
ncbi:DUF6118 family protein [Thiospirillum jenense]|uniref:AAA family ATPase n=1 Tax=Thiospirillum jenense TaxID=1653858 RepID=A0A839HHG7_9GAMM|nr:DUF6118 family protein [Thiospirillum jenense]MBB1126437.1 AAA family ATPase [Thiospirillum jenense]